MKTYKLLFFLMLMVNQLNATVVAGDNTRNFTVTQVKEDMKAQNYEKYTRDNFPELTSETLIDKGIISGADQLINLADVSAEGDFLKAADCSFVNTPWTATIYDFNVREGVITCMVAPMGDLNNPIGKFNVSYEKAKIYFAKDTDAAKNEKNPRVDSVMAQYASIFDKIDQKQKELALKIEGNQLYLPVPDMLTAAILTDTTLIDVDITRNTGKLTFKDNIAIDQEDDAIMIQEGENILNVYAGLSHVSMTFLIYLLAFFASYGVFRTLGSAAADKLEDKQNYDKKVPYIFGIAASLLLFIPSSEFDRINDGAITSNSELAKYDIMQTEFQDFERAGYSLFSHWATLAAKVIIDAEMKTIINKAGFATKEQIIDNYAEQKRYDLIRLESKKFQRACNDTYHRENMFVDESETKFLYSDNSQTVFPTSENWGYAMALNNRFSTYYSSLPVFDAAYSNDTKTKFNSLDKETKMKHEINEMFYPQMGLASCGKNYFNQESYASKFVAYKDNVERLETADPNAAGKVQAIEGLVEFQYDLFNKWSYLSILGLPITKMQTKMIGGLYSDQNNEVLNKFNEIIKEDSSGAHTIMSSIPYMFVPGAGTVFTIISENSGKLGAAIGGGAASSGGLTAVAGSALGGLAGAMGGGAIGAAVAYETAKTVLEITPIVSLVLIGLLRYLIILVKIFGLHFASLFILPVAFARENIEAIKKFSMKIFSTMLELPLFVLSIWLAVTANGLIQTIGNYFSKKIIIGMLDNNAIQQTLIDQSFIFPWLAKLKIYVFDGFMEVGIAVFSIVIIYKIIVSYHNSILDAIELQGSRTLDDAVDSMRSESAGWGQRV